MIANVDRVLAAVAALLLFTLNELRMFNMLPREADPATGYIYPAALRVMENDGQVYLTMIDVAVRWGLVGITVAAAIWALFDSFRPEPVSAD